MPLQTTCVLMSETQPPWSDLSESVLCPTQHHGTLTLEQLLCILLLYHTVRHDLLLGDNVSSVYCAAA